MYSTKPRIEVVSESENKTLQKPILEDQQNRNSKPTSVIDPVSTPPPRSLFNSRLPVSICIISARFTCTSLAVVKPIGTNFAASICNFTEINGYNQHNKNNTASFKGFLNDAPLFDKSALKTECITSDQKLKNHNIHKMKAFYRKKWLICKLNHFAKTTLPTWSAAQLLLRHMRICGRYMATNLCSVQNFQKSDSIAYENQISSAKTGLSKFKN